MTPASQYMHNKQNHAGPEAELPGDTLSFMRINSCNFFSPHSLASFSGEIPVKLPPLQPCMQTLSHLHGKPCPALPATLAVLA